MLTQGEVCKVYCTTVTDLTEDAGPVVEMVARGQRDELSGSEKFDCRCGSCPRRKAGGGREVVVNRDKGSKTEWRVFICPAARG